MRIGHFVLVAMVALGTVAAAHARQAGDPLSPPSDLVAPSPAQPPLPPGAVPINNSIPPPPGYTLDPSANPASQAAAPGLAPKFPPLTGRVVDDAGLLSPAARQRITGWLAQFEQATNLQVVVATVPTLHGYTIETYGYQLGRLWGFGKIGWNTGAILLVALKEHKVLIDIGYGFEAALPYALSETIIDQDILPSFRQSHYQAGILVGTAAILRAIGRNVASAAPTPRANGATNSCAAPTTVQEVVSCAAFSFSQLAAAPGNPFRDIEGDVATELSSLGWTIPPRVISYPGAFKKMEAIIRRGDERVMRRNQEIQAQSRETERQDRRDAEVWRDQEIQEELQETRDAAQDAANAAQWNQFNSGWPTYCQRYGRDSIYCY